MSRTKGELAPGGVSMLHHHVGLRASLRGARLPLLAIVAVGLAFSLPVALWGFPSGDPMHLLWARHFANQLWSGELYPRWLMDMNSGLGSPTFFFYGCVPYYVTSVFEALAPDRDYGWPALGLSASTALVASGLAAYVWLREMAGRGGALAGALVYMLAPYHLDLDYLARFAFAELWAFVWMPLILACAHRCVRGEWRAVAPLAIAYALLAMTHPPSVLIFSGVPLLYAVFLSQPGERMTAVARVAIGLLLGAVLAAVYLVPALTTQQNVALEHMTRGYNFYGNHFLYSNAPPDVPGASSNLIDYAMAFRASVGRITATTAAVVLGSGLIALLLRRVPRETGKDGRVPERDPAHTRLAWFWIGVALAALFMMTPPSKPIWNMLPILQKVQFPWRCNILLVCAAAALPALAYSALADYLHRWRAGLRDVSRPTRTAALAILAAVVAIFGVQVLGTAKAVSSSRFAERSVPQVLLIKDYPEYRPRTLRRDLFTAKVIRHWGETLPRAAVIEGTASVDVVAWRARHILLAVQADTGARVRIKQFFYPVWNARSSDGTVAFPVTASDPEALVTIQVPRGRHEIVLSLAASGAERAGAAMSALALLILLVMAWRYRAR